MKCIKCKKRLRGKHIHISYIKTNNEETYCNSCFTMDKIPPYTIITNINPKSKEQLKLKNNPEFLKIYDLISIGSIH